MSAKYKTLYMRAYRRRHPLEKVWEAMMMRCGHHKGATEKQLANYAGRGITVCEEWRHLKPFENWCLAIGWKKGLQLDRIDNNKGYCPENCRFVTHSRNQRNKSTTIKVRGVPIADFYDAYANKEILGYQTFKSRITKLHWPIEKALYTAVRH